MDTTRTVFIFTAVLLVCSAVSSDEESCSFHDKHLGRAVREVITKLPAERAATVDSEYENPVEISLARDKSKFRFIGLNTLRPFGPFFTFCPNGTRVVQVDLANEEPLRLVGPFFGESGTEHEFESRAYLVRFTVQFDVDGDGENIKLHHRVNMPVSMTGLSFALKGADKENDETKRSITRKLPPNFLDDLWAGMLFVELQVLFSEIAPKH